MKPVLRSLAISAAIVVGYPLVVIAVTWPLAILWGRPYGTEVSNAMMMPLGIPELICRFLWAPAFQFHGLARIALLVFQLSWFVAFNTVLYYVPVRLFLEWREGKQNLA